MGTQGKLNRNTMKGENMPLNAPFYNNPPYYYQQANWTIFNYETDAQTAAEILPAWLELPDKPVVMVIFAHYPFCTLGAYNEFVLGITCTFKGEPYVYLPYLILDSSLGISCGREVWGFPKKMGQFHFSAYEDIHYATVSRPEERPLITGEWKLVQPMDPSQIPTAKYLVLRSIPSPTNVNNGQPILQLIEPVVRITNVHGAWTIDGDFQYQNTPIIDPWEQTLPVLKQLGGFNLFFDFELDNGPMIAEDN